MGFIFGFLKITNETTFTIPPQPLPLLPPPPPQSPPFSQLISQKTLLPDQPQQDLKGSAEPFPAELLWKSSISHLTVAAGDI